LKIKPLKQTVVLNAQSHGWNATPDAKTHGIKFQKSSLTTRPQLTFSYGDVLVPEPTTNPRDTPLPKLDEAVESLIAAQSSRTVYPKPEQRSEPTAEVFGFKGCVDGTSEPTTSRHNSGPPSTVRLCYWQ